VTGWGGDGEQIDSIGGDRVSCLRGYICSTVTSITLMTQQRCGTAALYRDHTQGHGQLIKCCMADVTN
jgi:hypothetical protein